MIARMSSVSELPASEVIYKNTHPFRPLLDNSGGAILTVDLLLLLVNDSWSSGSEGRCKRTVGRFPSVIEGDEGAVVREGEPTKG